MRRDGWRTQHAHRNCSFFCVPVPFFFNASSSSQGGFSAHFAQCSYAPAAAPFSARARFSATSARLLSASFFYIIGSAEALPILCVRYFRWERERDTDRERETERDGSDVTIVALKLAMNLHFPLPKLRTIGDELTLSLAKNSHFSFLPSHFPSLPSRRGHHCGAEIRNEFTLFIAKKIFRPLCSPSFKWHEPRDEWSKTQDKWSWSNPAQSYFVLPIEKMNQINTKTLTEKIYRSQSTNQEGVRSV